MQENNTEKRFISRMKRTFHGHRIKNNQNRPIFTCKTSMSIPSY